MRRDGESAALSGNRAGKAFNFGAQLDGRVFHFFRRRHSTVSAELRVCVTPLATSPSAATTALLPAAALATLSEISPVATSCCAMAPTTSEVWQLISCMRWVIARIAATASPVELWTDEISRVISLVAFAVWTASDFTSDATTAKPRPASPARAASIVALSASRFVCSAMS
jgi:hypothetical protein